MYRLLSRHRCRDQRGNSGLETAIGLMAFVVVSSVFAFAALSAGQQNNEKSVETFQAGLAKIRSSLDLRGSVVLTASVTGASGTVSELAFQVANAAGGKSIDITPGKTLIKYTDKNQSKMFTSTAGFTATGLSRADSVKRLGRSEVYLLRLIDLDSLGAGDNTLTYKLGADTAFIIEVIPPKGAVLVIKRITPIVLDANMTLR